MTNLSRFAKGNSSAKRDWKPLTAQEIPYGVALAFDQTIRNTGWVVVKSDGNGDVWISKAGMLKTEPGEQRGWQSTLDDAVKLYCQIDNLILYGNHYPTVIAFESPPTGGYRTESSALAAFAVRIAADKVSANPVMVQAQKMKKLLTGKANATKPEVKEGLLGLDWFYGTEVLRNEHQRDAAGIGLVALTLRGRNDS